MKSFVKSVDNVRVRKVAGLGKERDVRTQPPDVFVDLKKLQSEILCILEKQNNFVQVGRHPVKILDTFTFPTKGPERKAIS